jgi:stage II sporulation protein D
LRSAITSPYRQRFANGVVLLITLAFLSCGSARAATRFYIRGGGNGHGIGLSQYGAYGYALHGRGYRWILRHYYEGTSLGRIDPRTTVRVLLATGRSSFSGASRVAGTTGKTAKKLRSGWTYTARPDSEGTVTIVDQAGHKVGKFSAPLTVSGRGPLALAGVGTYRGALELRPDGAGGIETVDAIGVDDYVRGVISAEMPARWAPQALRAQAVAARSYALTSDAGGAVFDLYSDTRSQMYTGVAAETRATDAAVAATRGQIVTYHGAPVITYFFSSSGGHTEDVQNVWPGATPEPYLRGVVDRYDGAGGDPYHHWGSDLTTTHAAAKLGKLVKGRLVGVRVTKHGVSPRVITAQVVGTRGTTTVSGTDLQQAFGLLTTYEQFTSITTLAGRAPAPKARGVNPAGAVAALMPVFRGLVVAGIHGSLFAAPKHASLAVERKIRRGWRTVGHAPVRHGAFDTAVPGPGTYRVSFRGIDGPAVRVP